MNKKWRLAFVIMALVGVLGYEANGIIDPASGDTWSEHFWAATDRSDLPSFGLGLLAGHFIWPRKRRHP